MPVVKTSTRENDDMFHNITNSNSDLPPSTNADRRSDCARAEASPPAPRALRPGALLPGALLHLGALPLGALPPGALLLGAPQLGAPLPPSPVCPELAKEKRSGFQDQ